jgi:hypothetical protein
MTYFNLNKYLFLLQSIHVQGEHSYQLHLKTKTTHMPERKKTRIC